MLERNQVYHGNCTDIMEYLAPESIDMTCTSPPYGDLRDYEGYVFDFEAIAQGLWRVMKPGGVVVWVEGDHVISGNEQSNPEKHKLYFQSIGFNAHDTMIYYRASSFSSAKNCNRYDRSFEYMYVFSKGAPKTFNPVMQEKTYSKTGYHEDQNRNEGANQKNKERRLALSKTKLLKRSENVWYIPNGYMVGSPDKITYDHPASFPEALARDHVLSWSNPGDLILDPMCGSGTTLLMAKLNYRDFMGIDISEKYCEIARRRVDVPVNRRLFE
jgi:DNA modification methylase